MGTSLILTDINMTLKYWGGGNSLGGPHHDSTWKHMSCLNQGHSGGATAFAVGWKWSYPG